MVRIARWTMAHRRTVVAFWIVATVGIFAISSSVGKKTASDFTLPGTGSQQAVDLLQSRFPAQAGDADQIVFHTRIGEADRAAPRAAIDSTLARVARLPHVTGVVSPFAAGQHAISSDGTIGFATVSFDERANALPVAAVDRVISTAESARSSTLQVELGGQAIEQAQQASLGFATAVGIGAAIIILLLSFGSFSAMGLPIATALLGLGAGIGVINLASHAIDMPSFASELALMIGLGVGIDYALFIVTRFRENYRSQRRQRRAGRRGRDQHIRPRRAVRRRHGRDRAARDVRARRQRAQRRGCRRVDRGGARDQRVADGVARAAQSDGRPDRPGQPASGGRAADRRTAGFWLRWVWQRAAAPGHDRDGGDRGDAGARRARRWVSASPQATPATTPRPRPPVRRSTCWRRVSVPASTDPSSSRSRCRDRADTAAGRQLTQARPARPGIASVAPPRLNADRDSAAAVVAYPTTSPQSAQTSSLVARLRIRCSPRSSGAPALGSTSAARPRPRSTSPTCSRPSCRCSSDRDRPGGATAAARVPLAGDPGAGGAS